MTIRSVAEAAGVSMSTVSNVLSGRHEQMAVETRQRVLAAIETLHYQPNHVARSLVTKRTATIGLIVGDMTNSLYPPVTVGAEEACREAGYGLLLANADDDASERRGVELMRAKQVDALVVFAVSLRDVASEHLFAAQAAGMPVVAINRWLPKDAPLSAVWFDHETGGRLATQHLIDLDHRRIAHIAGPAQRLTGVQRRRGYEAALEAAGIPLEPELIAEGDYSFTSGEALMRRLWNERPTAVFVAGDAMALGAMRALTRLGARIPDDCSLVAFGNPDSVRYATPAVTTIDLPVATAGQVAVELALRRMHQPEAKEVRMLDTSLLIRETTARRG
ncbi:MAG: LacI family DNA-binding transcriptional regulator [Thermomicrobiales bacterium]